MMLRPFARFQTPEEHQTLTDQVIKERKIRTIIEELKIMKKKGIKNLNEVEQAIKVKNKKDPSYKKGGSRRSLKKDKEEMIVKSLHRSEQ